MQIDDRSSYLIEQARSHDPDRFLPALLAPAPRREAVLALIVLNHELARVPGMVSQPMPALIRYQWWRDALEELAQGRSARQHPVVAALARAQDSGWLDLSALQLLIDARERELEGSVTRDEDVLEAQARDTDGRLQAEIHRALGGAEEPLREAARTVGTGVGLVRAARAFPPAWRGRADAVLDRALARIAAGRAAAGRPPRGELAAFLPGRLAAAEAARLRAGSIRGRPVSTTLAVLAAWLAGRP